MTIASVKDVGALGGGIAAVSKSRGITEGGSFQDIWSNQTKAGTAPDQSTDSAVKGDSLKTRDTAERPTKHKDRLEESRAKDPNEEEEQERLERASEVLGSAAADMLTEVAEVLDMPVEELQGIMDEMGMDTMDLLDPAQLGNLILEAGGAEDPMALLTDGELFTAYKELMGQLSEVLQQAGAELNVDAEQLGQILAEESTPKIQVDVAEEVSEGSIREADEHVSGKGSEESLTAEQAADGRESVPTAARETRGGEEGHSHQQQGESGNLLLQDQQQQTVQTGNVVQTMESYFSQETQDIMRQVMDYMRIQVKPDMSELQMQLHPESLGTLQVNVATKGGALTAQFVTQNETVKAALETQMVQLKESFAEQGVKVEAIEVTVQTHSFEQDLEQGRGGQQQEPEHRNRTRRINLEDLAAYGGMDELSEEEQLAAEMMTANGNTVDYTA